jgi:hypothetical protein
VVTEVAIIFDSYRKGALYSESEEQKHDTHSIKALHKAPGSG